MHCECEKLLALVDAELDRGIEAGGKPYAAGIAQGAARKLTEVQQRFFAAQALLIDRADPRYPAVCSVLRDLPLQDLDDIPSRPTGERRAA